MTSQTTTATGGTADYRLPSLPNKDGKLRFDMSEPMKAAAAKAGTKTAEAIAKAIEDSCECDGDCVCGSAAQIARSFF